MFTILSLFDLFIGILHCEKKLSTDCDSSDKFSKPYLSLIKGSIYVKSSFSLVRELKSPIKIILHAFEFEQYLSNSCCSSVYGSSLAYFDPCGGKYTTPQ